MKGNVYNYVYMGILCLDIAVADFLPVVIDYSAIPAEKCQYRIP